MKKNNEKINCLKKAFLESIEKNTRGIDEAAVLFSGGLDSSLIAQAVSKKVKKTVLYVSGLPDSKAIERAEQNSKLIGLKLEKVFIEKEIAEKEIEKIAGIIKIKEKMQLQIALPLYFALKKISEDKIKIAFAGQGADELFAGYDEFRRVYCLRGKEGAEEVRQKRINGIYQENISRDKAIADFFGVELKMPFLEPFFVKKALQFPVSKSIYSGSDIERKHLLREIAGRCGLPEKICRERKKAMQYDSGAVKLWKKRRSV